MLKTRGYQLKLLTIHSTLTPELYYTSTTGSLTETANYNDLKSL